MSHTPARTRWHARMALGAQAQARTAAPPWRLAASLALVGLLSGCAGAHWPITESPAAERLDSQFGRSVRLARHAQTLRVSAGAAAELPDTQGAGPSLEAWHRLSRPASGQSTAPARGNPRSGDMDGLHTP